MSKPFVPIKTADIEWRDETPYSNTYQDFYYSFHKGLEQSRHVFIEGNHLITRWKLLPDNANQIFSIGETGFGTGLNFLLTWFLWEQYAPKNCILHFISCEKHPLKYVDLSMCLQNWPALKPYTDQLLEKYPILTPGYHHILFQKGAVKLTLMLGDAVDCYEQLLCCGDSKLEPLIRPAFIDAWYLDGFAPKKNESMWSEALIQNIAMLSRPEHTTLATYTVAASVRAVLTHYGFAVERKPGCGRKYHILTACFKSAPSYRLKHRQTPWHVGNTPNQSSSSAIVVGAGLAGCYTAFSLARRGWLVQLIEQQNDIACGGSANQQAVLFPKLSSFRSPLTEFMLSAFLYAQRAYKEICNHIPLGKLNGIMVLAYNEKERKAQESLQKWLAVYPELAQLVSIEQGSKLANLPLNFPGMYIPGSGWINTPELCRYLINHPNIHLVNNTRAEDLLFSDNEWHVGSCNAPVVVLANAQALTQIQHTDYLPIKVMRGQMTSIMTSPESANLQIPLCGMGHVLPALYGKHWIGATYELNTANPELKPSDDELNYDKLQSLAPDVAWSKSIVERWSGIRVATPDYLPLVGPVAEKELFMADFVGLKSNANRWIASTGPYYPGLYVCAGFGSRGLTTIPLCAEWLAATINGEMSCLPRHLIQALAPARFLRRKITRD